MESEDLLHRIDKKVDVLEERCKALEDIKLDLKALRLKLDAQTAKQAALAATVALIVSLLFLVIKGEVKGAVHNSAAGIKTGSISVPPISVRSGISQERHH